MVTNQAAEVRSAGVEDNLFLNRYAQSVTLNGEKIKQTDETTGYGCWRLRSDQFDEIVSKVPTVLERKRKRRAVNAITSNILSNLEFACPSINITDFNAEIAIELANTNTCFSSISLITYVYILGYYPLPISSDEQEQILNEISDVIEMPWEETMKDELAQIQEECSQADIDYEFVIDSSGSVGAANWKLTMDLIAKHWIEESIRPSGSKMCGNHVAARWFSTDTSRFINFTPPPKDQYSAFENYTAYVAHQFSHEPFHAGGTATANALTKTRQEDIPLSRNIKTYVMVFTDGKSNDGIPALTAPAQQLQKAVDEVFAFGITAGINYNELKVIATNDNGVGTMRNFNEIEDFLRIFMQTKGGCSTESRKPYRSFQLGKIARFGISHLSATAVTPECDDSDYCPKEESLRDIKCDECSRKIASTHVQAMNEISQAIINVADDLCYPAGIVMGLVSRLSIENEELSTGEFRDCKLKQYSGWKCYGVMHIPEFLLSPGFENYSPVSEEHIREGVQILISLSEEVSKTVGNSGMSDVDLTRASIAGYDAGINYGSLLSSKIDESTTNRDFSADIVSRGSYFEEIYL